MRHSWLTRFGAFCCTSMHFLVKPAKSAVSKFHLTYVTQTHHIVCGKPIKIFFRRREERGVVCFVCSVRAYYPVPLRWERWCNIKMRSAWRCACQTTAKRKIVTSSPRVLRVCCLLCFPLFAVPCVCWWLCFPLPAVSMTASTPGQYSDRHTDAIRYSNYWRRLYDMYWLRLSVPSPTKN